jgi:hypothetical protein
MADLTVSPTWKLRSPSNRIKGNLGLSCPFKEAKIIPSSLTRKGSPPRRTPAGLLSTTFTNKVWGRRRRMEAS